MKINPIQYQSDENWIAFLRQNSEIKDQLCTLNTQYCVGYTYLDDRINAANGPIRSLGFAPNTKSHIAFTERNLTRTSFVFPVPYCSLTGTNITFLTPNCL